MTAETTLATFVASVDGTPPAPNSHISLTRLIGDGTPTAANCRFTPTGVSADHPLTFPRDPTRTRNIVLLTSRSIRMALCSYAACSPARAATRTPKRAPSPKQSVNYPSARRRVRCANGVLGRLIHLSAGNRVVFARGRGHTTPLACHRPSLLRGRVGDPVPSLDIGEENGGLHPHSEMPLSPM